VAAVVRAFHALRQGRPLPDPPPTIMPPGRAPDVAQPPAGARTGPPLPRRVKGARAMRPLGRAGDAAPSRRVGGPGIGAPSANGNGAPLAVASPANGNRVPPAVAWPANGNRVPPAVASPGASGRVPASGQAPAATRARPEPADPVSRPAERTPAVSALDGALLDLAALTVAVGAFVAPWAWLVTVAAATLAGAVAVLARDGPGPRTLARRAGRRVVAWLRPRSLVWLPVLMARVAIVSVLLPSAVGAGRWLVEHGSEGAVAAGRAAGWHHGFRVAAAAVCFLLVTGSGAAHDRRALELRRRLQPLGTAAVVSLAVAASALVVWVPLLGPRVGGVRPAGADDLAWAPPALHDEVDRVRDAIVRAELHAATVCLSERQDTSWDSTYTDGNPPGERDVATLRTEQTDPAPGEVATAVVAVHNQLAAWVEDIEVVAGEASVARVERWRLPTAAPAAHAPVGAATVGSNLIRDGVAGFDRGVALRCSAGPVL
jgi:hypothetical protein